MTFVNFDNERMKLVSSLKAKDITDERVLSAVGRVKRELFVPHALQFKAYEDGYLPIGFGQTISTPSTVALMTQLLELKGKEKVLEIGTGSGYQTALLSDLAGYIYSVEKIKELAVGARKVLEKDLRLSNVIIFIRDGSEGLQEFAPFDRILVTACSRDVPEALTAQLAEGGVMVIPIGSEEKQEIYLVKKENNNIMKTVVASCRFVPLVGRGD